MKAHIDYIDSAKGLLMILVIFGHIFGDTFLCSWIYTFHMPAFFIISGILLNYSSMLKKTFKDAASSRIKTLLIPFCFFELLGAIADIAVNGYSLNPIGYAFNSITQNYNNNVDWFIISLFIAEIVFYIIHKFIKQKYMIWIVAALILISSFSLIGHIPNTLCRSGIALAFIVIGFYTDKAFDFSHPAILVLCFAFTIVSAIINGTVGLFTMSFGNPICYIIGSLAGSYFSIVIAKTLKPNKFVQTFGKESLIIMGTQIPLIKLTYLILPNYALMQNILRFALVLCVESGIIYAKKQVTSLSHTYL